VVSVREKGKVATLTRECDKKRNLFYNILIGDF
jgi:hypothetical protein